MRERKKRGRAGSYLVREVADRKGIEAHPEDAVEALEVAVLVEAAEARRIGHLVEILNSKGTGRQHRIEVKLEITPL